MERENPHPRYFDTPLTKPPMDGLRPLVDNGLLKQEMHAIFNKLSAAKDNIRITSKNFGSEALLNQWNKIGCQSHDTQVAFKDLAKSLNEESPIANTLLSDRILVALSTAESVLFFGNFERLKKIAERNGFLEQFEPYAQLTQFYYSSGVTTKVEGLSVIDILKRDDIPLDNIFRFFVEASLIIRKGNQQKILDENQFSLRDSYPAFAKATADAVNANVVGMIEISTDVFEEVGRWLIGTVIDGNLKNLIINAIRIHSRSQDSIRRIRNTLLDPSSCDFIALRQTVEKYLKTSDIYTKLNALSAMGLNSDKNIRAFYTKARELGFKSDENRDFYNLLTDSTRMFLEEVPQEMGILTSDDLPLFIDTEEVIRDEDVPTFEDLQKLTTAIFQNASQRKFEVETDSIDWKNVIAPASFTLTFPKGHPRIFIISLHYENEQGETKDLDLQFDTKREIFELQQFMPSVNDPEMKGSNAFVLAAYSILSEVQKHAEVDYQERQRAKEAKVTSIPQLTIKKSKQPYVPRKKEKVVVEKPPTPFHEAQQTTILPTKEEVKNQVLAPEKEEIKDFMRSLSSEDQKIAIDGITKYNEIGVGRFKMLRSVGREGQRLYTLRITGTGGGIRVLMEEKTNGRHLEKSRNFEIVDIRYRKDIYRKRGL